MNIQHHIPETMLLDYMSGQLNPEFSFIVSCHLEYCATCRSRVEPMLAIGGNALETIEPQKMEMSAQDILLSLQQTSDDIKIPKTLSTRTSVIPSKSELFDEDVLRSLKYQFLCPGVRQHIFKLDDRKPSATSPRILWNDPGIAVPSHGHHGTELTQVLVGGYYDGDRAFTKGNIQIVGHQSRHQPTAMDDGPCMVLAAAEAPLNFKNILPRLLQPLFKI